MANKLSIKAILYLLETSELETRYTVKHDVGFAYWGIKIKIGKLKGILRVADTSKYKVSAYVRFRNESGISHSDAYEISDGWGKKKNTFIVCPNTTLLLSIVRRNHKNLSLYRLSRSFADSPLDGESYDISAIFRVGENEIIPQSTELKDYIKDGELNEL